MITLDEFEEFIHNDFVYQQKLISVINEEGKQIYLDNLGQLYKYNACTIKLEQMERYSREINIYCTQLSKEFNNGLPVTCHVFRAFKNSKSFGLHTDPDNVIIQCVWGKKRMYVDGKTCDILTGEQLFIKANTPHEAINDEESLMLSFGMEKFFKDRVNELDVLPKDNRDLQFKL
jgi:hypothetical protein